MHMQSHRNDANGTNKVRKRTHTKKPVDLSKEASGPLAGKGRPFIIIVNTQINTITNQSGKVHKYGGPTVFNPYFKTDQTNFGIPHFRIGKCSFMLTYMYV